MAPQLGLQRHWASKGAPKGFQGVPKDSKKDYKDHQGYSKHKRWETYGFFNVILRLSDALVCFRASGDIFLRSITRAIINKKDGKRKVVFSTLF